MEKPTLLVEISSKLVKLPNYHKGKFPNLT